MVTASPKRGAVLIGRKVEIRFLIIAVVLTRWLGYAIIAMVTTSPQGGVYWLQGELGKESPVSISAGQIQDRVYA